MTTTSTMLRERRQFAAGILAMMGLTLVVVHHVIVPWLLGHGYAQGMEQQQQRSSRQSHSFAEIYDPSILPEQSIPQRYPSLSFTLPPAYYTNVRLFGLEEEGIDEQAAIESEKKKPETKSRSSTKSHLRLKSKDTKTPQKVDPKKK